MLHFVYVCAKVRKNLIASKSTGSENIFGAGVNLFSSVHYYIMSTHPHLLSVEMKDAQEAIEKELQDIQEKMMMRNFDEHSKKSLINSSAKTVICTS